MIKQTSDINDKVIFVVGWYMMALELNSGQPVTIPQPDIIVVFHHIFSLPD